MEVFLKFIIDLLRTTKAMWLVLLGAGVAIYAHNRTTKLAMSSKAENQRIKLRYKSNLEKVNSLKELYKQIQEVSSLYSIFMAEVKYKISRKQCDALSEKVENIKIIIIEKLSTASMLIEFYADENNADFINYQRLLFKGIKIWEDYKLIDRADKNFIHRYCKAQLNIITINSDYVKEHEYLLRKKIGAMGKQLTYNHNSYESFLEELSI